MDISYLLALQNFREVTGGVLDGFFLLVTYLGSAEAFIIVAGLLYWCVDKSTGEYIILNGLLGNVVNSFVKVTACVYRPWMRDSRIHPLQKALKGATGYSFPSGHTSLAMSLWGGLAVRYRRNRKIIGLGVLLWLLVAFSRNYVGVHTPQDTVVASLLGVVLLWLTEKLYCFLEKNPKKDTAVALLLIVSAVLLTLYTAFKSYPMDYRDGVLLADPKELAVDTFKTAGGMIGFSLGWIYERRRVRFSAEGTTLRRVVRFVVGIVTLLALKVAAKAVFSAFFSAAATGLLEMTVVIFYAMGGYPALFRWAESRGKAKAETGKQ